jgi:hypothetical protein
VNGGERNENLICVETPAEIIAEMRRDESSRRTGATIVALPPRPSTAVETLSEQDHVLIVLAAALFLAHEVKVGRGVREAEWGQARGEERLAVGA